LEEEGLWNAKLRETKKSVTAVMSHVKKREFVVNACIITEKEGNYQHVILLQKWKLPMTEV
jgi:hypothetical protein